MPEILFRAPRRRCEQKFQSLAKRLPSMAVPVLFLAGKFRERLPQRRKEKNRIVPEAAISSRSLQDFSFGRRRKQTEHFSGIGESKHAHKTRTTALTF